jgi:OmpA-OmpF porin, OOP family
MQIKKLGSVIGFSAVLLLGPLSAAQAQSPGLYVGASWGAYSIKESSLNENEGVMKAVFGGQFNSWLALEGSWVDFNDANNSGDRYEADGKGLAVLLSMPVGKTSETFVKIGQFWWNSDSYLGGALGASSGNDPFYGIGFKLGFNDHLSLRSELERYHVADARLNTLTVGLEFKF